MLYKIKNKHQHGELFDYILWKTGINKLNKVFNSLILKIFDILIKFVLFVFKNNSERYIAIKYFYLKKRKSDIHEHLDTLYRYATKCDSIFETGVRGVVSSWGFLKGLLDNKTSTKIFLLNDIEDCNTSEIEYHAQKVQINLETIWRNNLEINLNRKYDLVFIDTWHVYGQLRRELDKFSLHCNKYIIMHDTTLDGDLGESLRYNMDIKEQSKQTGFTIDEIEKGLWPAIEEFLDNSDDWELEKRYENCNGLTILKRI